MLHIHKSFHFHAGRWLQSGCTKGQAKKYADYQEMSIVGEYSDEGKSGKSVEGRPQFKQMLSDIEMVKMMLIMC